MPNFVCDFGHPHPIQHTCDCQSRYKTLAVVFRRKMNEVYGHWRERTVCGQKETVLELPIYAVDISDKMRIDVLNKLGAENQADQEAYAILEKMNLA